MAKLAAFGIERQHLAGMDVDEPAVQRDLAPRHARRHRRMRAQMGKLRDHIFEADGAHQLAIGQLGIGFMHHPAGRAGMAQPGGGPHCPFAEAAGAGNERSSLCDSL